MNNNKKFWLYISFGCLTLMLLFWFVFVSYKNEITLSLTSYFFLLVICSLAVTAFLSGAFKSTSTWSGTFFKGNLSLAGPPVIFFILIIAGYQFRPTPQNSPFDLTIFLEDTSANYTPNAADKLFIENGNSKQESSIGTDGSARFHNVNAAYRGGAIKLEARLSGYTVATRADTTLTVPDDPNPVIHLSLMQKQDSALFTGFVVSGSNVAVPNASINFTAFQKKAITNPDGMFSLYLPAHAGDKTDVLIIQQGKIKYDNKIILSTNIKIPLN